LLVPLAAAVALTAATSAFTFYTRLPPADWTQYGVGSIWLQVPSTRRMPPAVSLYVDYEFHGCSEPVSVHFSSLAPPSASDTISRLTDMQVVREGPEIPYERAGVVVGGLRPPVRSVLHINGIGDGLADAQSDPVVQLRPRSLIGSCYLQVPSFFGPWAGYPDLLSGAAPASTSSPLSFGPHTVPLTEAYNTLALNGRSLTVFSGESPTEPGDPTVWGCQPASVVKGEEVDPCGATVMLTDSWYQTWQNLMLLFIGALFAAVVALVGRAIAGLGWFAIDRMP
jgi:hypothetical protein